MVDGDGHSNDAGVPLPCANEVPHNIGENFTLFPRVSLVLLRTMCVFVQVLLQGHDAVASSPGQGSLGCCPQQDPLWPDLTVHQHLEVYAAVRGMRKEDADVITSRYKAK